MFNTLKKQIQDRFTELTQTGNLFYIDIDRDKIWELYLDGFADPVVRQDKNCNCCKSFLRQYAGIVAINDNKVMTIWDVQPDELYRSAVKSIRDYVLSLPITDAFINTFEGLGTDSNLDTKTQTVWHHYYLKLPKQFVHRGGISVDAVKGNLRDNKTMLKRALEELKPDAVDTVLELIAQGSLYRGNESNGVLTEFRKLQKQYSDVPVALRDNYVWLTSRKASESLARIRNTAIGTLLIDLSEGMDLDTAVTRFEKVVAPTNYKRPTALVTPRMVEEAKTKLTEAGYLNSLERRFAVPTDISVNDLLFVDKSSNLADVFEEIKKDAEVNPRTLGKVEEIGIEKFLSDVVPAAKSIHLLLENSHLNNMATLLTTADNDAPVIFKWTNPFSWAYTGGITDAIKERVKAAGGKVDGELRVSLSWSNYDDLDIHVVEPRGNIIYYGSKFNPTTKGSLDVDMNAGGGTSRNPVENITWPNAHQMEEGVYKVKVHQFASRETIGNGFTVQVECRGEVFEFEFPKNPRDKDFTHVVEFSYSRATGIKMVGDVKSQLVTKDKWNLRTNRFHKIKQIMLSPNYWGDNANGNKHYLFAIENCLSDESTRPFFNEYLKEELSGHRKFFEVLAGKLSVSPTSTQVSGLGFSETQRNHAYFRVDGAFSRTLKVNF